MVKIGYILAASHSGSTMLAMLLGAHPEICTVGELEAGGIGDPERYRCSCGTFIRQCGFWQAISERMAGRGLLFDVTQSGTHLRAVQSDYARRLLRPLHRGRMLEMVRDVALSLSPAWRRHWPTVRRYNSELTACLLEQSGAKVLVDSSKVGIRLKYLLRNPDLDVRIIRAIRDGRGVALTYMDPAQFADARDPARRGGGTGGTRDAEKLHIRNAAREWRRSNEEAEALLRMVDPSRHTQVRYEELCRDPKGTLARLARFLEVDPARVNLDFRSVEHHVLGNGMRLDPDSNIVLDERWRTIFDQNHLAIFNRLAGDLNCSYGYE